LREAREIGEGLVLKQFSFRLEQVLRHRANIEEMRERALAEVEAQITREEEVMAGLGRLKGEVLDDLATARQAIFDGVQHELFQRYLAWLGSEQDREHRLLDELGALREAKRGELVKASQDRRIVEKLKDREFEAYGRALARADQAALDEVATNAFARGERSWHTSPRSPEK
jgi:flagellar FliJ protein